MIELEKDNLKLVNEKEAAEVSKQELQTLLESEKRKNLTLQEKIADQKKFKVWLIPYELYRIAYTE